MYKKPIMPKTTITRTKSSEGETIEMKMHRIINNKEPLTDGAPLIYSDYKEGVNPMYDIRTDKMEMALEARDKVTRNDVAKRKEYMAELKKKESPEPGQESPETGVNSGTTD